MRFIVAPLLSSSFLLASIASADSEPARAAPTVTPASVSPAKPPLAPPPPEKSEPEVGKLPQFEKGIEFQPKSPGEKVAFSLEDADLNELLRVIGQLTGRRFVIASSKVKSFKATVYSPQKISVAEAYQAFLSILQSNGLTVLPAGSFWKVVDTQDVTKQSSTPLSRSTDTTTGEERYVTRIHRLAHVSAEEVATNVLSKFQTRDGSIVPYAPGNLLIITDTGDNIRRMTKILDEIDTATGGDKVWMEPLFYVASSDLEKKLSDLFDLKSTGKQGTSAPASADYRLTKLLALDRPNAIVLVGTEASYRRALDFIKRIDVPVSSEGDIHVVALQHADAKKLVPSLNEALQGATAAANGQGAHPGSGPLAILEAPVKVSAEETTNSILITSSERDFAAVREVIRKLDQPRRQVYIEAVVMDVSVTRGTDVGVKYHGADALDNGGALYGGFNAPGSIAPFGTASASDTTLQALALGVTGPSVTALGMTIPAFGAMISLYARNEETDILSTPHILATDNTPAEIHVQLNTSLQQNAPSIASAGSGAAAALSQLTAFSAPAAQNYGKIGPKVKITPHLNGEDEVRLEVEETISDIQGTATGTLGTVSFMERGATTTLTVRDQQTVVIGGLVRDKVGHTTVKVPLFGDIPILGALFRHKSDTVEKSNLVLILTPYIIREQDDLRRIFERKMQERQEFLDHTAIFSEHTYEPHTDYTRTRGLLAEIRRSDFDVDERRRADEMMRTKEVRTHEPTEPLELPAPAASIAAPAPATHPAATPIPATRPVERVER